MYQGPSDGMPLHQHPHEHDHQLLHPKPQPGPQPVPQHDLQEDPGQMVFVDVKGIQYPVMVVGPDQFVSGLQRHSITEGQDVPSQVPTQVVQDHGDVREQYNYNEDVQAQESPTAGMSRSALQELARARGPKMQLFSSYSMPTLPVSKNAPFQSLVDSPFQSVVDNAQRHSDALEHAQQQMASIYKVISCAGVDVKWVIMLLREIAKSKVQMDTVIEMLESSVTMQQFRDFEEDQE